MASIEQYSFSGGIVGDFLQGRVDQVKYANGLKQCHNAWVQRFGGVENRPGSMFISSTKGDAVAKLVKFVFNDEQSYIIEIGNGYLRFYQNAAQLVVTPAPAAWVNVTVYNVGSLVSYLGVYYYSISSPNVGQQPNISSQWAPLTGNIYEVPSPYVGTDCLDVEISQSADVMNFTHPGYAPLELRRFGQLDWRFSYKILSPTVLPPGSVVNSGAAGATTQWVVTSVTAAPYDESVASLATGTTVVPSSGTPITISWAAATGAAEYNVYRLVNGVAAFIGTAIGTSFIDNGIEADTTDTAPIAQNPFNSPGNYPAISNYYQQRLFFARTYNDPEKVWGSRTGLFDNFNIHSPLQDDDAISFTVVGKQVNEVRSLVDLGTLFLMTSGSEYKANGDSSGTLTPFSINLRQQGTRGTSTVQPIPIENTALFIQARGSIVRDLRYDFNTDGYNGRDLTVFAPDLFSGYTILSWDYQENPDSIVWAARDDGMLLGLTYMREQEVWAWHTHETDGAFESVCSIPENGIDYLYWIARRTVNGVTRRYIERLAARNFTDIRYDAIFLDASLTYDGRNTTGRTMTLSGGVTWLAGESLTLTCNGPEFVAGDVGNTFVYRTDEIAAALGITVTDGRDLILTVTGYTSANIVTVTTNIPVITQLQNSAYTQWSRGVDDISGLSHLEGKTVGILADGNVQAPAIVTGGAITLASPHTVIHVGLPYTSDVSMLDIANLNGQTVGNKNFDVKEITLKVYKSRGLFFGPDADHLVEWKQRAKENWNVAIAPYTGRFTQAVVGRWTTGGSLLIRQSDPLPMNILAVIRTGEIGGR